MEINADHFEIIIRAAAKRRQKANGAKAIIKKRYGNHACNKCNNGIIGKTAAANANGRKYSSQEKKTYVRTDRGAGVNALAGRELLNREIINDSR